MYSGLFFNLEDVRALVNELNIPQLIKEIPEPHVTFAFVRGQNFDDLPEFPEGQIADVTVVGYGFDDENVGLEVKIPKNLMSYYHGADSVHITTSVSATGKPVNTARLKFQATDRQYNLRGVFKAHL